MVKKTYVKQKQALKCFKGFLSPSLVYSGGVFLLNSKIIYCRPGQYSLFIINFFSLLEYASHKTAKSRVRNKGSQVSLVIPLVNGLFSQKNAGFYTQSDLACAGQVKGAFRQVLKHWAGVPPKCTQHKWSGSQHKIITLGNTKSQQQLLTLAVQMHGTSVKIMRN